MYFDRFEIIRTHNTSPERLISLPVNSMLTYTVGALASKCVKGLASRYFCSRATVHDRNTRNNNKLDIAGYKSVAGQRSFLHRSVTMCKSFTTAITDRNSLEMFKRRLKTIFSNYIFRYS